MSRAVELVRQFRHLRALVIGDAMLDTYLEGTAARLCSEGPVPVVRKTSEQRTPGGAANTAANLAALDADVHFLSIIGHDMAGSLLRTTLHNARVSDTWLIEDNGACTLHKLRILADGQYVVRFDDEETARQYAQSSHQPLLAHLDELFPQCDLVVISDYTYGVISDAIIERLQILQATHQKVIVIDSKDLLRFRDVGATVVTPNLLESQLLVGNRNPRSVSSGIDVLLPELERMGGQMLSILATKYVAITLAGDGVFLINRQGETRHIPAHRVLSASDIGAGDSFAAALALALAAGGSIEEAAAIGIDAAGIAITKHWTAIVRHQELLQRVSLRDASIHSGGTTPVSEMEARVALSQLTAQLNTDRRAGRTIVFTNGVFDILHVGHVQFLRQAKMLGDVLVVGINNDRSTRRLKGKHRPVTSERDRMALVAALDPVDHVILFDEDTPTELLRVLRPDIHVKGGDYEDEDLPEAEAVREGGGRVVILPLAGSLSTTSVIERIIALAASDGKSGVEI